MGTITKALEMLDFFSRSTPELGLKDFVRLTGRDKATVHRHLVELLENGFLEQHPESRAYSLGPTILRLTAVREATKPVRTVVVPLVESMANQVGELVHFSLLHGTTLSPVCHHDPARFGTQVHFDEAEILPMHATSSGLALLAFGPESLRDAVLSGPLPKHATGTETDPDRIRDMLDDIRQTGFGVSEQAFDNEVNSQAVPIFGPNATVVGALGIALPHARLTDQKRNETRAALALGVQQVTHAIGGVIPDDLRPLWRAQLDTQETAQ